MNLLTTKNVLKTLGGFRTRFYAGAVRSSFINLSCFYSRKYKASVLCVLFLGMFSAMSAAEVYVISGDKDQVAMSLTKSDVVNIFMGRTKMFDNGDLVAPLDQNPDNPIREEFYRKLTGKNARQISAYWARLLFTGRHSPPQVVDNEDELSAYLENNLSAIAYTGDEALARKHTILFMLQ